MITNQTSLSVAVPVSRPVRSLTPQAQIIKPTQPPPIIPQKSLIDRPMEGELLHTRVIEDESSPIGAYLLQAQLSEQQAWHAAKVIDIYI